MRFIVRPRAVTEGVRIFDSAPFVNLQSLLESTMRSAPQIGPGGVTPVNFLSAFSIDVPDARVPEFNVRMSNLLRDPTFTIRPANELHAIPPPPDPAPRVPASLARLALEPLWNLALEGTDVHIGVIDEGFGDHPCLKSAVQTIHHYVRPSKGTKASDFFQNGRAPSNPNKGHGTFAAALIAGSPVNGIRIGVAPAAKLHLVELPDVKFEDDLAMAIEFLADQYKCRVISISLGTWKPSDDLDIALQKARSLGALTVAAIGNSKKGVAMWPGACSYALSVGYCDDNGGLITESGSTHFDRGRQPVVPLVLAPGVMLSSADSGTTGTCQKNGSSFAAPLVAGLAGLLFSAERSATPGQVEDAITSSCPGTSTYDERCAYGVPDGAAALSHLRGFVMR